ncbi:hypothetical protein [Streptomyces sp. NPDC002580]|uniref:hypothetical protein n=1 Tax=Streptomyces sp. NPDC002580 TaxID=3364653 RepID=UPI0036B57411
MTTRPTRAMWWAEMAAFLVGTAAPLTTILLLIPAPAGHVPVTLDAGTTCLLLAVSVGVGVWTSGRFRAWGLRRRTAPQ